MQVIKLDNVKFEYKQYDGPPLEALKGVSFSVEQGEFIALVGANGSGKSTLAKLLNGLLLPTDGKVEVFGRDTADGENLYEIRKNVGMVFQNPDNQMVATIVEDDVAFGPENLGVERQEIVRRVTDALAAVGMSEYAKSTPFKMSGGQKQRIAIAGALALKPQVLVLDEATSMLDPKGRRDVMDILTRLNKEQNITIIHITHHMDEVTKADRVFVLNEGTVALSGMPSEIFDADLEKYKLARPIAAAIAEALYAKGFDTHGALTAEELAKRLCQ